MGVLIYFCAGLNADIRPTRNINGLLLNVPDNGADEKTIRDAKALIRLCRPKTWMLDSGGFTIYQGERDGLNLGYDQTGIIRQAGKINLTPPHVIRSTLELNPDIVVSLDFPIAKIEDREQREIEFRRKLGFNASWAIDTAQLREKYCPEVRLFVPIQCYSLDHFDIFYRLIQEARFDGYSMPVRNLNVGEIILFLMRFRERGIKQVHLLGTTKIFIIALCAYMAKHFFDWVSFDSTTWNSKYGTYFNPHDLVSERIIPEMIVDEGIQMACDCPWCKGRTFTYIKNLPITERTALMRCHNHWLIETIVQELFANSNNVSQLRAFLMRRCRDKDMVEELSRCLTIAETFKESPVDRWKRLITAD